MLIVLAVLWEAYARWNDSPLLFPSLTETLAAFWDAAAHGPLIDRTLTSLGVLAMGYGVGLVAAAVGSVTPIDDIGRMVNIGTLLAFVIVCIAIMVLRKTNPGQARPFRTPWVPVIPILGILFNGYMMYKLGWVNWARLFGWLAIGLVVYFGYGRRHSILGKELRGEISTHGVSPAGMIDGGLKQ